MQGLASDVVWQNRLERIDSKVEDIRFPDAVDGVDQDEEWCEIVVNGEKRQIRFHDYADVFGIPGLILGPFLLSIFIFFAEVILSKTKLEL